MCNGTEFTYTICARKITTTWKTCDFVPFIALSKRNDKSIRENELTAPHAMKPAACKYKKIEKDSHVCDVCQPKEKKGEEWRKNSVVRRMSVGLRKALDMITKQK